MSRMQPLGSVRIRPLGELVTFLDNRRRPVKEADRKPGPYPYLGANGQQGTIDGYIFDEPLVLLAEDGGHFDDPQRGIAYRVAGKVWVNNHAHVLRPGPDMDWAYLARALENLDVRPYVSGTTRGKLTKGQAEKIKIPVPAIAEQRRIAAILDEADALRAKRRAALAQLDEMARAIFVEMFGDPATNPKGWPVRPLGELVHVRGGKRLPKGDTYSPTPTPYRYIRVSDLGNGQIDASNLVFLRPDTQRQIARYTVDAGDIIISIAGSIGEIACVPPSLAGANLTENAAKLVAQHRGDYRPEFLADYLRTPFAQGQIGARVGQVTIGKLALFRIEQLAVLLPPVADQASYVERMKATDRIRAEAQLSNAALDALFASLQHRAFRGEL
jgi:type I restriction enzyme S subunit